MHANITCSTYSNTTATPLDHIERCQPAIQHAVQLVVSIHASYVVHACKDFSLANADQANRGGDDKNDKCFTRTEYCTVYREERIENGAYVRHTVSAFGHANCGTSVDANFVHKYNNFLVQISDLHENCKLK